DHASSKRYVLLVLWNGVPVERLYWNRGRLGDIGLASSASSEYQNMGDDFPGLLRAIEAGTYPLERLPDFPLPVATLPVKVNVSQAYPAELERLESILQETRNMEELFMGCYIRKSEGVLNTDLNPMRRPSGNRLDAGRLA